MSSLPRPGMLSRSLSRAPKADGSSRSELMTEIAGGDASGVTSGCPPGEEDDRVGKFSGSPAPATSLTSHAVHIPGFRAHQPQQYSPIILGSMGRSCMAVPVFGSLPVGSLAAKFGKSPEAAVSKGGASLVGGEGPHWVSAPLHVPPRLALYLASIRSRTSTR